MRCVRGIVRAAMTAAFNGPGAAPPYYGWLMLLGIGLSAVFWTRLTRRNDRLLMVYCGALLGAFLGAKAVYLLVEGWHDFHQPNWLERWLTGKTILGALLGGYAGVELSKKAVGYSEVTGDWFASIVPVGVIIGRVGCLLHGCCLGEACERPAWWTLNDATGLPRWPAVPVEIAFNLAALGVFWALRRRALFAGQHFHLYLMAYGLFRFVHEFWRATPRLLGPLSGYQLAALAVIALGAWGFRHRSRTPQGGPAVS